LQSNKTVIAGLGPAIQLAVRRWQGFLGRRVKPGDDNRVAVQPNWI
jgi:hypothetical protein